MLLINDCKPQAAEPDIFLDEGMGADHHIGLTASDCFNGGRPRFAAAAAPQQDRLEAQRGQEVAYIQVMLLRQDFGWNHECGLVPGPAGERHRLEGHDGLATADVTLDQPVHGMAGSHILNDFKQDPPLRRRHVKREQGLQACHQRGLHVEPNSLDFLLHDSVR